MSTHPRRRALATSLRCGAAALALALPTAACSLVGTGDDEEGGRPTVVLLTHDSFALPDDVVARFEKESGYRLEVRPSGDAGQLVNELALTAGNPTGDVAFGVDNAFASRALEEDVFATYSPTLPPGADRYALAEGADRLTPVDTGNVCVNVDDAWFARHDLEPPATLADLTRPAYRDLFVLPGAETSSPGLAFLLATVAAFGADWPDYWTRLLDNGAKLTAGWTDAYTVDFTAGGGDGSRPIVLSYDSSPAFTIGPDGRSTTSALLRTCFRQVEYAGVLAGATEPEGAERLVDFLLTPSVQDALPDSMYVFPVRDDATLPDDWARFARQPGDPYTLDPADIAAHRDEWLRTWSEVTAR